MSENQKKVPVSKITEHFIDGFIVVLPPAITALVVMWLVEFAETTVGIYLPFKFPGAGLIAILFSIWFIGFVSGHKLSKRIIKILEWVFDKIPVVKFIYSSVKHFSTAIFESNSMFQNVVLVPYKQSLALGFLLSDIPDPIREKLGDDYVCVFLPWSLNITSGRNLFVEKSKIIHVDMKTEDALQFMLTAGCGTKSDAK